MNNMILWYGATSVVFGVLLFFPLKKFMMAISINKAQKKLNRELNEEELGKLNKKIWLIAAILSVTFAFLYNKVVMIRFMDAQF